MLFLQASRLSYTFAMKTLVANLSPWRLFALDALGALVSALMLGVVLVHFRHLVGVPAVTLRVLALIAVVFALYSATWATIRPSAWPAGLRGIAIANLAYCVLTFGAVVYLHDAVTLLGALYFAGEIVVVTSLAVFELRVAGRPRS